jgi:heptosyltransferase III
MFFLAHFYIKILQKIKKILIVIQRSNGDVFLSLKLINELFKFYQYPKIDLLINDDTYPLAKLLPNINSIYQFSYTKKRNSRISQEVQIIKNIFRKYDLSINLTSSDRSVLYALFASSNSISAIENNHTKSWWKKLLLKNYYYFDNKRHILLNNLSPLSLLGINYDCKQDSIPASKSTLDKIQVKLKELSIKNFIIFHPSAQYEYKIYPIHLRHKLIEFLQSMGVSIIITGSKNNIDQNIKNEVPLLSNVYNFIGETSIEEYIALSQLSSAYIGMDTLNMHISASQNKRLFTIFGPSNLKMWSPWSNSMKMAAKEDMPLQTYGNITIFQAALPCVACGMAGCDDKKGRSECLYVIDPEKVFFEVNNWFKNASL